MKKLIKMVRKWQRLTAASRKRISFSRSNSIKGAQVVEKGHFVVYTSDDRRFALPLAYLQSDIFRELLRMAEEEFGLAGDGRELVETLLLSFSHCHCSSSVVHHQQAPITCC